MIGSIVKGFAILLVGLVVVFFTNGLMLFGGRMDWADEWLGVYGGSRLGYKLVGVALVIIGLLMMTGLLGPLILRLFGPIFIGFDTIS